MIAGVLREFLHAMPGLSLGAIAQRDTPLACALPFVRFDAEEHPTLLAQYLSLNRSAFPKLPLAGWVMTDLFVLPTAISVLMRDDEIRAAWVGVPTLVPGRFQGVSLFAVEKGLGAWVKLWGAYLLGAKQLRGVVQVGSPAIRTHSRIGPMKVVGPTPAVHELAAQTFIYETDVDPATVAASMHGKRGRIIGVTRDLPAPGQVVIGLDADGQMQLGQAPAQVQPA
jgi:hypothetical protein